MGAILRRLSRQIYLTIIASLVLVVLFTGFLWRIGGENPQMRQTFGLAGDLAAAALPPPDAPPEVQQAALGQLAERLHTDLALYAGDGRLIAQAGRPLPHPRDAGRTRWMGGPGGPSVVVPLQDGGALVIRIPGGPPGSAYGLVALLAAIALAVALGAYPVVRGLTGRLERLQRGVEKLGAGDLGTRVKVEGRDEIAGLAASFNRAAERIEGLVGAHRLLLANTSHELRTPLARIRLGIELAKGGVDAARRAELERDIAELDGLLDEILLASRLDAVQAPDQIEPVDLLGLAAEEGSRYDDCQVEGEVAVVDGDARLLRRMLRNLLENAVRHGAPPVTVTVRGEGRRAIVEVVDAGKAIPPEERERIFDPFYRRADSTAAGTGLGLSLVRQIARLHGGDAVVVARAPGNCFRISLPRAGA
jgi:signal transduction histidine kinase